MHRVLLSSVGAGRGGGGGAPEDPRGDASLSHFCLCIMAMQDRYEVDFPDPDEGGE